jgi:prepilin peptidase CpaA
MQLFVCAIGIALLGVLAWFDVVHRRLPGGLVGAVAVLYFIVAALYTVPLSLVATHVAVALFALFVGALLFAAGLQGGGDVKFAAAVFLWAGAQFAMATFALISLSGLVVALVSLAAGRLMRRSPSGTLARIASPWIAARGVPYGVAISLGALPIVVVRTLAGGMLS